MGVDYVAYSNILIKPIPIKYRAEINKGKVFDISKLYSEISKENISKKRTEEIISLACSLKEVGYDRLHKHYVYPDTLKHDEEFKKEFYDIYEKDISFLGVNWHSHSMYFRTEITKMGIFHCRHSEFDSLSHELVKYNGGELTYFPPSTVRPPEYGFVTSERAYSCFTEITYLRHHYKSNELFTNLKDCMRLASESGILIIV